MTTRQFSSLYGGVVSFAGQSGNVAPASTWANRPSASGNAMRIIFITDIGDGHGSFWISDGTYWYPWNGYVTLASSAVAVSGAGDTNENTLSSTTIPANMLALNGLIKVTFNVQNNNSGGTKTWRVRYTTASGNVYFLAQNTTVVAGTFVCEIQYRNSSTSNIGGSGSTNVSFGAHGAPLTASTDNTIDNTVVITGQKSSGADTITLDTYRVEVITP